MSGTTPVTLAADTADAPAQLQRELVALAAKCAGDPLAFVRVAFPWGTGTLAQHTGPDVWQRDLLAALRDGLSADRVLRIATASGNGVGKSAAVSWIILWGLTTMPDCRIIVTASTAGQLAQKTFAEVAKWHRLSLWRDWFDLSSMALVSTDPAHAKTWRCDATPWSEENVESFQGLHNEGRRTIVVFDEASAIPPVIWDAAEGCLTDGGTERLFLCFGNPGRPSGKFFECFHKSRHRWDTRRVDSRDALISDKAQIADWIADHGLASDFIKVRVLGLFPSTGVNQLIAPALVEEATKREAMFLPTDPLVIGCDIARFGEDATVIWFRRGRDARSIPPTVLRGADTMEVAARIAAAAMEHQADGVFVDGGGVGGGVIDRLNQMRVQNVFEVQFGGAADRVSYEGETVRAKNKRAEMWLSMRTWLAGGAIPNDRELIEELTAPEYSYDPDNRIVLESKDSMRKRGLASPDRADALACTFAYPVTPRLITGLPYRSARPERRVFDPHSFQPQQQEHPRW